MQHELTNFFMIFFSLLLNVGLFSFLRWHPLAPFVQPPVGRSATPWTAGLRVCGGGVYIYASDEINIKSQKTKHSVIGEYFLDPWSTKSYSSSVYSIHIFIMYSILTYIFFVANKHILKTKKRTGRKWRWMNCKKICLK